MRTRLTVAGALGRMGKRIISLAVESGEFDICGAVERAGHPDVGKTLNVLGAGWPKGVSLASEYAGDSDVVIDFSIPDGADAAIEFCDANSIALVMGTTGLNAEQKAQLREAAEKVPVVYATNMSVGMNVLFSLVGKTAQMLGDDYDIEIVEQHHRFKKDAPSGSALTLAENICKATGRDFPDCLDMGRSGKDAAKEKGRIGIHAIRAGDITGIHSVIYSTLGETVTLNGLSANRPGSIRWPTCSAYLRPPQT
jgi:4-hydroxy-tetrahydrodipicolinate reductase